MSGCRYCIWLLWPNVLHEQLEGLEFSYGVWLARYVAGVLLSYVLTAVVGGVGKQSLVIE